MAERIPAPSLEHGFQWLNTDRPLDFGGDLRGQVVLLDFWTYCCINCMHVLPDLASLEERFRDEPFVVIGVHSNKFTNEGTRRNVRSAVLRYEIAHPVVVDEQMHIWRTYGVRSWPTRMLIDPEGYVVGAVPGEGYRQELERAIQTLLDEHRARGTLAPGPPALEREAGVPTASRLRFPGKVFADAAGDRLFISDSNHNRIVVTTWPDGAGACDVVRLIGSGECGLADGPVASARFDHPQGLALDGNHLYVADTENHALRRVDTRDWSVTTVAGTGDMANDRQGGGIGTAQGLNSPWDVAVHDGRVIIAMAGTHQLWVWDPGTGVARVLAGSGREDIIDGPALQAALAQPSGLALLGDTLYFADSETSAIRGLDLRGGTVSTVIGTGLFDFGDADDTYPHALCQHPLGIAAWNDALVVADTYNHKLKLVDPRGRSTRTLAGLGEPSSGGPHGELGLYEPGGVSVAGDDAFVADTNHHRLVRVNLRSGEWAEVMIRGLERPGFNHAGVAHSESPVHVASAGPMRIELTPTLPTGARLNADAPVSVRVTGPDGAVLYNALGSADGIPMACRIERPVEGLWRIELHCGYCTEAAGGHCEPHSVTWDVPVTLAEEGVDRIALRESA